MTERHARAAATRGVSVRDLADAWAELSVILPATVAYGIRDRLRRQAAAIRAADTETSAEEPARSTGADRGSDAHAGRGGGTAPIPTDGTPAVGEDAGSEAPATLDERGEATPEAPAHAALVSVGAPAEVTALVSVCVPAEVTALDGPSVADDPQSPPRDTRTLAQIGADLCADLLLTAVPAVDPTTDATCPGGLGAIRGHVQITVPVMTLLGRTDVGASLDGSTPIDPQTARHLAARAPGWDRVLCDPVAGTVLEVDRYSPTTSQRRFLAARDRHCRAPGCRAPIARCQLDHNHEAHDGGPTHLGNLAYFCVRHHTLKTETEWTVTQEADGSLRFHSPLGQDHREKLTGRVMFVPDADPAPF
ncbi:HNH endonuclease signature motif containing protein [Microbacterium sp. B19]|uniref:HNH endonuclease signature motif containing protein n=1 Tax=Microbacterium sp. B19 TaxID=96765 RepID=UPI0003B76037|nr:HNH endonuclease signature motif containing protein [Microbacterium sp. B19]